MRRTNRHLMFAAAMPLLMLAGACTQNGGSSADDTEVQVTGAITSAQRPRHDRGRRRHNEPRNIQLGPRPFYLVEDMDEGSLKDQLLSCTEGPFKKSDFSIGHRGAALQFPEHTKESYEAGARMGAGILECDVTFTKDRQLVCRHSQCDLHTTTNILAIPELAAKCTRPFTPADPATGTAASAQCCTSDITLAEFKTLCGKMDASNPAATTPPAVPGRHAQLPHRPVRDVRHAVDPRREHRAHQGSGREVHARAEAAQRHRCRSRATTPRRRTRSR